MTGYKNYDACVSLADAKGALPGEQEVRVLTFERVEHIILVFSFVVLAWTGFALKYPDQWWARPILLWEASRDRQRAGIHRIASVVFMSGCPRACALSNFLNKKLRVHWRSLLLNPRDLREALASFAYNLGLRKEIPVRSPHSFIEKSEYWALVWGSAIMVCTGIALWANGLVLRWLPKVVLDVATSIHFYEAVLATLAIIVWHFYFVIFDPDVYPMDTAWLTGKSPRNDSHAQLGPPPDVGSKKDEDAGK